MKKQILRTAAAVLLIILAFTSAGWAQEGQGKGRLSGEVRDEDKNPIAGVKLTLDYLSYDYQLTDVSDKNGKWAFIGLGMGLVNITAEKDGFVTRGIQLNVSSIRQNPSPIIILKRIEDIKPGTAEIGDISKDTFTKATALYKEAKYEAALALFQDFRKQQPLLYKIGINIGNCFLELQRFDKAIEEFQKAAEKITEKYPQVKGNEQLAQIYASIGDTYMRQDKLKEAEETMIKAHKLAENNHAINYYLAVIFEKIGKKVDAIKHYEIAKITAPSKASTQLFGISNFLDQAQKAIERLR